MNVETLKTTLARIDTILEELVKSGNPDEKLLGEYTELYSNIATKFVPNNKWFTSSMDFVMLPKAQQNTLKCLYIDKKEDLLYKAYRYEI